tara:strand:+ start:840 stop:1052 length:213 start_codon:yes stop_codon:yes gene_type:complete
MAEPTYTKDPRTGAVIFTDSGAYQQRKIAIQKQKEAQQVQTDSRRVINSMRSEIKGLKKLVYDLIENRGD